MNSDRIPEKTKRRIRFPYWILRLAERVKYWFVKRPDSNYIKHAKRELVAVGYDLNDKEESPNKWIMENLFELLNVFDTQGHSGSSAPYCIHMFQKLASFEPLCPLTGEDSEWNECGEGKFQNKRCSHVFKDDERAYDSNGKIFREPNGCCYTNKDSRVTVAFPYTPKCEYVDVPSNEEK